MQSELKRWPVPMAGLEPDTAPKAGGEDLSAERQRLKRLLVERALIDDAIQALEAYRRWAA